MTEYIGKQLGNYHLRKLLGQGGFADVYLGKHVYLNTLAAIKVLRVRLITDDQDNFLNEARTIAELVHPHIVRVLDFGVENNTPFLVMEYAPNGTLRQHYPKGSTLPFMTIVSHVRQISAALNYAHNKHFIHRDIKPENLLLGTGKDVLLSDFGTALVVQASHDARTLQMAGTIMYMAPEQIQGKPTIASDQYALAVVVYEWLCGECPFQGSFSDLYRQHLLMQPPSLRAKVPTIPPDVEQVVMTALAKDPERRFRSVRAFATAFEQACLDESHTIVAGPMTPLPPTIFAQEQRIPLVPASPLLSTPSPTLFAGVSMEPKLSGRLSEGQPPTPPPMPAVIVPRRGRFSRRLLIAGLAGVVVASGIAGGTVFFWPKITSRLQKIVATPVPTVPPDQTKRNLLTYPGHSATVNALAWAPDGIRIVSASTDKTVQIWDAHSGNMLWHYTHDALVRTVAWSHDGRYIASGGKDKVVQVWDATTQKRIYTYPGHTNTVTDLAWSPNSLRIASVSAEKDVHIWDALNGENGTYYRGQKSQYAVTWSPDGKYLASGGADQAVHIWDAHTQAPISAYTHHVNTVKVIAWSPGIPSSSPTHSMRIASTGIDGIVHVWDALTENKTLQYREPTKIVHSIDWSPDSSRIVSGSDAGTEYAWDPIVGNTILAYKPHGGPVTTNKWSPNGTLIASGYSDGRVVVWKVMG